MTAMREIKFRGYNGEKWLFGNLDIDYKTKQAAISDDRWWRHPVRFDTVGQFTTQTDNNGEDIYEGDILRVGSYVGTVVYDCDCFEVAFEGGNTSLFRCLLEKPCVVIGNVHDSPELLEGKDA